MTLLDDGRTRTRLVEVKAHIVCSPNEAEDAAASIEEAEQLMSLRVTWHNPQRSNESDTMASPAQQRVESSSIARINLILILMHNSVPEAPDPWFQTERSDWHKCLRTH